MSLPTVDLDVLLTGRAQTFTRPGSRSAIAKSPCRETLRVTTLGLEGDEQGDLRVHGGVEKAIHHYAINPFDLTKVWPHKDYPLIEVGVLELNRNPENVFAEVEQAAFNPAHVVPGIGFSPDKMLQGRLFSYGDAQRYRLGVNNSHIPVNAPRCPFHSYHRDGQMRVDGNHSARLAYGPNSRSTQSRH